MSSIFELFGSIVLDTSGAEKALAKVSKAGQKVGGVLGKGFKLAGQAALQMGKVIGAGVAAVTTAMGKLVSSAMSAYASYEQLEGGVKKLFGEETLYHMPPMMGSEDFANYAAEIPAVFGFIGCRDEANGMVYCNHHEKFDVNETLLPKGTALMAQFAVDYLAANAK